MDSMERTGRILAFIFNEGKSIEDRTKLTFLVAESDILPLRVSEVLSHSFEAGSPLSYQHLVTEYGLATPLGESPERLQDAVDLLKIEIERRARVTIVSQLVDICNRAEDLSTEAIVSRIESLKLPSEQRVIKTSDKTAHEAYLERKEQSTGMWTTVSQMNEVVRGLQYGTMTVVAAFASQGKSTTGLCWAHFNLVELKYNEVILTMEVPAEIVKFQLLSAHSNLDKFKAEHDPINYERIMYAELTDEEEEYVFKVLEPDLFGNPDYGKIKIVEPWDFGNLTTASMDRFLDSLDFEVDALFVDYAQLLKYAGGGSWTLDEAIFQFYQLSLSRKIILIIMAQTNREGWKEACENEGRYTLRALADSNELERGAYRVFFLYLDDELKEGNEIKIMLGKNRGGRTVDEPIVTPFHPEFCSMGDGAKGYDDSIEEGQTDLLGFL